MTYQPKPIDTTNIILPPEFMEVSETIAKNIHEVWAKQRIEQGWKYGPVRNDALKTHPNLVPYEELPEIEKDYDRNTLLESLKVMISLGFTIK